MRVEIVRKMLRMWLMGREEDEQEEEDGYIQGSIHAHLSCPRYSSILVCRMIVLVMI